MSTIKVVDSTFSHNPAIGYAGERTGEAPKYFRWSTTPGDAPVKVFTDIRLEEALTDSAPKKIALLLECPSVNSGMYEWVLANRDIFDTVLTHQKFLVDHGSPFRFYPFGGSWIRKWGLFPKTKMVSMLVSTKGLTEAHMLRHKVVTQIPDIAAYGTGVSRWVNSKATALRDYRFAVIIENEMSDWWFTEKLIDAFSQGTIPIYRGCPDIGRFFNTEGMIRWTELETLKEIIDGLTPEDYDKRHGAVAHNLKLARLYQCAEDWIHERYGDDLW